MPLELASNTTLLWLNHPFSNPTEGYTTLTWLYLALNLRYTIDSPLVGFERTVDLERKNGIEPSDHIVFSLKHFQFAKADGLTHNI